MTNGFHLLFAFLVFSFCKRRDKKKKKTRKEREKDKELKCTLHQVNNTSQLFLTGSFDYYRKKITFYLQKCT